MMAGKKDAYATTTSKSQASLPEDNKYINNNKNVVDDDVSVDDGYFADVGFMFEGNQPTRLETFEWQLTQRGERTTKGQQQRPRTISVQLRVVDDEPGALQSGHYLWPASKILADHFVASHDSAYLAPANVVELGAGCALLSCMALQLWQPSLECIVVTDHDPG